MADGCEAWTNVTNGINRALVRKKTVAAIGAMLALSACLGAPPKREYVGRDSAIIMRCNPDDSQKKLSLHPYLISLFKGRYYITSPDPYVVNRAMQKKFYGEISDSSDGKVNREIRLHGFKDGCYLQITGVRVEFVDFIHQEPIDYLVELRRTATPDDILMSVSFWEPDGIGAGWSAILRDDQAFFGDQMK